MSLLCLGTSLPPALAVEDWYSLNNPAESEEVKQLNPKGSSGCKPFSLSELMDAVVCSGDTDSSSDFEAIPTMRGLQFRDQPSPSRSAFDTPPASVVGRAASINSGDNSQFETPRAAGIGSGLPFGGRNPVQMQGPLFQVNHQPETCKGPGFKSFYCLYYLFLSAKRLAFCWTYQVACHTQHEPTQTTYYHYNKCSTGFGSTVIVSCSSALFRVSICHYSLLTHLAVIANLSPNQLCFMWLIARMSPSCC